jgi:colanic acid biosynthesis glycosyl transferase WcaI
MAQKQGFDIVPQAIAMLARRSDIHFVFCGDGPARERLRSDTIQFANVHWMPLQPADRLNELLNLADIHLLPQRPGAGDLVMPSKLTGMLASGRPVVTTAAPGTQLAEVVESLGLVVPPEDANALASAVEFLADNPELRQGLGRAARRYAEENLDADQVLSRFERELLALVDEVQ